MKKAVLLLPLLAGGLLVALLFLLRKSDAPSTPPLASPGIPAPSKPVPAPPAPARTDPEAAPGSAEDPVFARCRSAIRGHNPRDLVEVQSVLVGREDLYKAPLMKLAQDDPEPRVRSFSVAVLGRMKQPPPEAFFAGRLADAEEYPRTSACQALERLGSAVSLVALDRAAAGDAAAAVRTAAAQAAKAVRSR
jgi:hypothetical protein